MPKTHSQHRGTKAHWLIERHFCVRVLCIHWYSVPLVTLLFDRVVLWSRQQQKLDSNFAITSCQAKE